jgi:hypothetical protein
MSLTFLFLTTAKGIGVIELRLRLTPKEGVNVTSEATDVVQQKA